ncbi:hypothetical protein [Chryseobacterium balustinum]|uniref:Uncharacterized protein n=1 Tax=Chryseobacterium balustinum TaxID=246 RepID=A0AAX2ILX5_9FLAO|nr:hypothetical protein [Chryseobacterium balustinum]AZB30146.1 hypothetical protein EB354_13280 [Chryseobacterium balustinum]SKB65255.1 hypothetical protein SAMN05421800_10580 [Chryseobacterium balustinum]SQA90771.1 Uncharacterised protein [Chryseobacterium balustinum]
MDKENRQPDGVALLKKVIETNEATIEHYITLMNSREDIVHMDKKIEASLINLNATLDKSSRMLETEEQKRQDFLLAIPKTIEANFSDKALIQLEQVEKKSSLVKTVFYGMITALFLSVVTAIGNIVFAKQWYTESLRSKSELRQEILNEIRNNGQSLYRVDDYDQLKYNTELMNRWMNKNPKDAEKFLRFKDGYESR